MRTLQRRFSSLISCFVVTAALSACSSSSSSGKGGPGTHHHTDGGTTGPDGGPTPILPGGDSGIPIIHIEAGQGVVHVSPDKVDLTVNPATGMIDPVQFTVTGTGSASVTWIVSNPALGTVDQNGLFTPTGKVGGTGTIQVVVDGKVVATAPITLTIAYEQNGADGASGGDAGAGGLGGVGGDGFGGEVSDDVVSLLKKGGGPDAAIKWLYPYDETVFPLDILPPLFQWTDGSNGPIEAISIHLSSPPYFDYKGFFGRPARLAADKSFVRHPIPKDIWRDATLSAAGATLSVELTFVAGGKAYGPIKESYKIALAPINGIIYYQSYNTAFVQNFNENAIWGGRFGGATLSIEVGADSPKLVAGATSSDRSGCRVCHSVSAYGDRMVVQHENGPSTSTYDLKNGNAEAAPYKDGTVGWAGLSPDGNLGLANSVDVTDFDSNDGDTKLYDMTTGEVVTSPGLNEFATRIALPSFSPDSRHAAFGFWDGPGTADITPNDGKQLVAMDFDVVTRTFSNPQKLWEAPADGQRVAFSSFFPSSDAVVFQRRWQGSNGDLLASWKDARSELWWVDLKTHDATPLNRANGLNADGTRYIPTGDANHGTDDRLNYEPSISPVASGGYAWMVFMSRRLYGNVAVSAPWNSDPRSFDTRVDYTTKKIWMVALDLNPTPGKDPSHPAFYIPGQELQGSNSRPFFSLQPCVSDRGTCVTGIDCCTGFCRDGLCVPPPEHGCSQVDEKCKTSSDCCENAGTCIGGFCSRSVR